ncbi:DUF3800 domain-containing protein [Nocardioides dubius]|uniref:DUF3800 domain-containing protein n=1 Tax=Nocardioides dubius TaxID=317019 RepID=A0ABN1TPF7_9ACTN
MGKSGNPAKRARQERVRAQLQVLGLKAMRATFYCDESGNTGAHWADEQQPIFVHGGWLVPRRFESQISTDVAAFRARHKLQGPELKWQKLSRRPDPAAAFRELFKIMADGCSVPFFFVMDKEYITSAKVVETFFDPAYNSHLPMAFTSQRARKKQIAEIVLQADDVRGRFAQMLKAGASPSPDTVRHLAHDLASRLSSAGEEDLAATLFDFSDAAIAEIQSELAAPNWLRTTLAHSLPGLTQVLEKFVRARSVELEIVHDALVRQDETFAALEARFRPTDGSDRLVIEGQEQFALMPTVTGVRLADSKDVLGIQLADLLCGFVRTIFAKIKRGEQLTEDELVVCFHLAMGRDEWGSWDANLPRRLREEFAKHSIGPVARGELDPAL